MSLRREIHLLLLAIQFYTRLPVRLLLPFEESQLSAASRYAGLAGALVAGGAALLWWPFAAHGLATTGALLAVFASAALTGAFHEDGLADSFDGLGGGRQVKQVLAIMKDSRIGTYGAIALLASFLLRSHFLASQNPLQGVLLLLTSHMSSRAMAVSLIGSLPYLREDQDSKVKPIAKAISRPSLAIALLLGSLPLAALPLRLALLSLATLVLVRSLCASWFRRRLGGYTGDLLGACEQLGELAIGLLFLLFAHLPPGATWDWH
jgi:adenosylcobinamide-GDP ribazoletransferase